MAVFYKRSSLGLLPPLPRFCQNVAISLVVVPPTTEEADVLAFAFAYKTLVRDDQDQFFYSYHQSWNFNDDTKQL